MQVTERDQYSVQRARVGRIVNELAPGKRVEFDEESTFIRFRVRDEGLRVNLTEVSGEWFADELAEKPDSWLRNFILRLSNGKLAEQ
jgi:hypothetical protein